MVSASARPHFAERLAQQPTCVYRVFDVAGRLLYVGASCNPLIRIGGHKSEKPWFQETSVIRVSWYPDRETALEVEATAIGTEAPIYNRQVPVATGSTRLKSAPPPQSPQQGIRRRMKILRITYKDLCEMLPDIPRDDVFRAVAGKTPPAASMSAVQDCLTRLGYSWSTGDGALLKGAD